MSAPAAIPFSCKRALLASTSLPSPPARCRGVQTPGAPLPPTPVPSDLGTSGHPGPRGLARAAGATCPCARLGARGRQPEPRAREPRRTSPVKARATSAPGCALTPPAPSPPPPPVPLGPERNHSVTSAQLGGREGAGRPRGCPSSPADAPGLGPGPAAPAQPGSYRGVSREAAAAALQPLLVRRGLGASPAAGAQSRRSRPAARSAVAAGERRARVRAGPAAATGAPRRRRCRRLW